MKNPITPLQHRVLSIIIHNRRAASDDAALLDDYWHTYDGWSDSRSLYDNLSAATPSGSVTRARRRLHELGYITYSQGAEQGRYEKFKQYKEGRGE